MTTWPPVGASLSLLVGVSGCVVGPGSRLPQLPVPSAWIVAGDLGWNAMDPPLSKVV
jgi:hypothetical protein